MSSTSRPVPPAAEQGRRGRLIVVVAGALTLLAALTAAVSWRQPLPGETRLLESVVVTADGWRAAADAVARATDLVPLAVLTGLLVLGLLLRRRTRAALLVAAASATVWLVNPLLKALVARPRPDVVELPSRLSDHAFPSGHAANSAVLVGAVVLVVVARRHQRYVALPGAVALAVTAAAQLALGRHQLSDIVAGWLLAVAVLAAVVTAGGSGPSCSPRKRRCDVERPGGKSDSGSPGERRRSPGHGGPGP